jgi:ribonuclease HII
MVRHELYAFDDIQRAELGRVICGIDEAGRGPLAGPVCCAAVVLDPSARYDGLDDSKKLSERTRERLYGEIVGGCVAWGIAMVDNEKIDEINILAATMLGMRMAAERLSVVPEAALVDGNRAPECAVACRAVTGGDGKSACIAAASIIAKVTRDRFMRELAGRYPGYGFERHKGYPTKEHYAALAALGPTPYHRRSFLKGRLKP